MKVNKLLATLLVAAFTSGVCAIAQDGGSYTGYTPYSIFGIGELAVQGSAYNKTMGGTGLASRNNRYLNPLNPAAVTARDSLAFMTDFSYYQNNKLMKQGNMSSANNLANINNFTISFPIFYSKIADASMMLGIKPYSSTGYKYGYYETNPGVLATVGNVAHSYSGIGSLYQLHASMGFEFFDRVSVGAEWVHYFGNIKKGYTETITDQASLGIAQTTNMSLSANSVKFGFQYEQPLGKDLTLCVGGIYSLDARLGGYVDGTLTTGDASLGSTADTLLHSSNKIFLAGEMGLGVSVNYKNKFRAEIDYTRSDWTNSGFENFSGFRVQSETGSNIFTSSVAQSLRAGVEIIPNPDDIRYYRNVVAYRAGVFFNEEYFRVEGNPIYNMGITLGMTLPVFRYGNGITLGMELGQRGTLKNNLIRESYVGFSVGVNLYDIWFRKPMYE